MKVTPDDFHKLNEECVENKHRLRVEIPTQEQIDNWKENPGRRCAPYYYQEPKWFMGDGEKVHPLGTFPEPETHNPK